MTIALRQIRKRLGRREVLRDVSLEIPDRELFFVLGPSGGGKTTLLRLLAGLLQPDAGEIWFGEQLMNPVPAHLRRAAMVFQHHALWPHLTVADNIGYGLDVRRIRGEERKRRVAEALAVVRLEELASRLPEELSGGQQQRVALARAIVIRPDVLLLDEPLSNLDPRLRGELREEIRRIQTETQVTMVYVTHDQKEALSLAGRAAVLNDGRIEQVGLPDSLYRRPTTRFVADFLGEMNWLEGTVRGRTADGATIQTELGEFVASGEASGRVEGPVWLGFRPRNLRFGAAKVNPMQVIPRRFTGLGEYDEWVVETAGRHRFKHHGTGTREPIDETSTVSVFVEPEHLVIVPRA